MSNNIQSIDVIKPIDAIKEDLVIINNDLTPSKSRVGKFLRKCRAAIDKIVNFLQKNVHTGERFKWESKQERRFNDLQAHVKNIRKNFDHSLLGRSDLDNIHNLLLTMKEMTILLRRHDKVVDTEVGRIQNDIEHLITEYEGSQKTATPPHTKRSLEDSIFPKLSHSSLLSSTSSKSDLIIKDKISADNLIKEEENSQIGNKQKLAIAFINLRNACNDAKLGISTNLMNQDDETIMQLEGKCLLEEVNAFIDNLTEKYKVKIQAGDFVYINIIEGLRLLKFARDAFTLI